MREEFPFTACFFIALVLKYRVEAYLHNRQMKHLRDGKNTIPAPFEEKITLEEHKKATDYNLAHLGAGRAFSIISLTILLIWTMAGGLEKLNQLVMSFSLSPFWTGMIFIALFSFISTLLKLPEDVYETFVIEEKFGFNRTTVPLFIKDLFKSLMLSAVIGLPMVAGILWFMEKTGNLWWLWAFAFTATIQVLMFWLYPVLIAPLFNKFFPLDEGELKERLKALLEKAGFKSKGLFVMDASKRSAHGNAYFTGFGKNKRVVLFDTLLLNLTPVEVEAVLAHELGHFKKKHTHKNMALFLFVGFMAFALMGLLSGLELFYKGHGITSMAPHMTLVFFAMILPVYSFPLVPLFSNLSRKMEFEADSFAKDMMGEGKSLGTALLKTYKDNSSPLSSDEKYSSFYYSHPPIGERLKALSE